MLNFKFAVVTGLLSPYDRSNSRRRKLPRKKGSVRHRTSTHIALLTTIHLVILSFCFITSSLCLLRIFRASKVARQSLRSKLVTVHYPDNFEDSQTAFGNVIVKFRTSIFTSTRKISFPPSILLYNFGSEPDYNGLYFDSLPMLDVGPKFSDDDKGDDDEADDDEADDDNLSATENDYDSNACQPLPWTKLQFPTCNVLHETIIDSSRDVYLGHGYFRDVWLVHDPMISDSQMSDFVLKQSVLPLDNNDVNHLLNAELLAKNQKEALIMERLSSSPRIVNIYGHCGTSVIAEAGDDSVAKAIVPDSGLANRTVLEQLPFISSFNTYSSIEKLDLALEMSKAIADIHGFAGGIIVHGDIHPVQWLLSRNKRTIQLNDFNNAEILGVKRQSTKLGNKRFCKVDRGTWRGVFRSPEEYLGDGLDEKVDVYSMGNMIYSIVTGLWPFYDVTDYDIIGEKLLHSERPYVDPRYFTDNNTLIERQMIDIMKLMWDDHPQNRPTIFEVVEFLSNVRYHALDRK